VQKHSSTFKGNQFVRRVPSATTAGLILGAVVGAVVGPNTVPVKGTNHTAVALRDNDAYGYLGERDSLVRTGPTGTNVNGFRIHLVGTPYAANARVSPRDLLYQERYRHLWCSQTAGQQY